MVDRPVIFSASMVRALLAGRKTQTRRLATSPLRRVEAGDRLYVREHWSTDRAWDGVAPRDMPSVTVPYMTLADQAWHKCDSALRGKHRQGMHMPRWASRLTLIVEGVKVEPLQGISERNAEAEGITQVRTPDAGDGMRHFGVDANDSVWPTASRAYRALWNSLHVEDGQRWEDNPDVVALTFRVEHGNIDTLNLENARG